MSARLVPLRYLIRATVVGLVGLVLVPRGAAAGRQTLSLDGSWQVEESVSPSNQPPVFKHTAPVPGVANLAKPPFVDVDQFDSQELIANRIRLKRLPESARIQTAGTPRQERNFFWYRKSFHAPEPRAAAVLRINKAQFGTAVWLNGKPLGEYPGCFSASHFVLTDATLWKGTNELVIRIGAHPGVLPVTYPTGTDFEKLKWTPGIYDSVSVSFCDNPVIESIQVAPRIGTSEIVVQTRLKNYGPPCSAEVGQRVKAWKSVSQTVQAKPLKVLLRAGEEKVLTQRIAIPNAKLWSPEDPFLYVLDTTTGGDGLSTRFGMREFRSDASTKRFYLNGKVCYLRGSNITLHRFFEDPNCGALPWNEQWLRRLLVELPHQMHWNSFRFCIGPVPDRWLEIADEAGLLIQNEFFIWTGAPSWDKNYARHWDVDEMVRQYGDWMRDGWNHPSVAIWDANNETRDPVFGEKIIPAVRPLDLSNRPWENSYNAPVGPDDPVEYHPYLFHSTAAGNEIKFRLSDLEQMEGKPSAGYLPKEPHPILINEYGWVWLNRDGSPTLLTETLYPRLLGTNSMPAERFAWNAYVLAAKTEYWRAYRQCAGVLHFVYLTCSYPGVFTADNFLNVKTLKLEPNFADYVGEAFKPLGVYVNFFQPTLAAGAQRSFTIKMVNDLAKPAEGELVLSLETEAGLELAHATNHFQLVALGDATLQMPLTIPTATNKCILKATARPEGEGKPLVTVCRRWVTLTEAATR